MSLRVSNLAVRHPNGSRFLFQHLDFELPAGTILGVVGCNGAGKSTLLRCLAGVLPPDEGTVSWNGHALAAFPRRRRAQLIGYLPQATPLHVDLRVRELVALGRTPYVSRWGDPQREAGPHVERALEQVDMRGYEERRIHSLSGGELQRVMFARMLATQARLLVLDEPTAALDIRHTFDCLERLRDLARTGVTVILALHDLELCRRYADTTVCLGDAAAAPAVGASGIVLTPDRIERVFGVRATLTGQGLTLSPATVDPKHRSIIE